MEHPANSDDIREAARRISDLIEAHAEWFFVQDRGARVSVRKSEVDFSVAHNRLIFSCWTERGTQVWRVTGWEIFGEKLRLEASRRTGAERATLELIPRASVASISETVTETRRARCEMLARLACEAASC